MTPTKCARCGHYTFIREMEASPLSAGYAQAAISKRYGVKTYTQRRPRGTQKGHLYGPDKPCYSSRGFHWQNTGKMWPNGRPRYTKITDKCDCPAFVPSEGKP